MRRPFYGAQAMIHLYTGDGKGKTTAAAGLALRRLAAGGRVMFVQFMKGVQSGEIAALGHAGGERFAHRSLWDTSFVLHSPKPYQRDMARRLFDEAVTAVEGGGWDMIVLDEICPAVGWKLLEEDALLFLCDRLPRACELVLTGQGATPRMIERADLVSEMRCVKHYYDRGIAARKGIEY